MASNSIANYPLTAHIRIDVQNLACGRKFAVSTQPD